jgi:hypothetical protein
MTRPWSGFGAKNQGAEPQALSGNLVVQRGVATEELNRSSATCSAGSGIRQSPWLEGTLPGGSRLYAPLICSASTITDPEGTAHPDRPSHGPPNYPGWLLGA